MPDEDARWLAIARGIEPSVSTTTAPLSTKTARDDVSEDRPFVASGGAVRFARGPMESI